MSKEKNGLERAETILNDSTALGTGWYVKAVALILVFVVKRLMEKEIL